MSRIFLSYRRDDSAPYAGRLYDRLAAHFGADQVFMDIDRIEPGENFVEAVNRHVDESGVVLVMIGPNWVRATDTAGGRRLDDANDFVRMEVAAALARGVRVIPVRVGGAAMPRASDLPPPLQSLVDRQAIELSDTRFHADAGRLIEAIEKVLAQQLRAAPASGAGAPVGSRDNSVASGAGRAPRMRIAVAIAALAIIVGGGWAAWLALRGAGSSTPAPPSSTASPKPHPAAPPSSVAAVPSDEPTTRHRPEQQVATVQPTPQPAPEGQPAKPAKTPAAAQTAAASDIAPAAPREAKPAPTPARSGPTKLRVQDTFAAGSTYSVPLRALLGEVGGASATLSFEYLPSTGTSAGPEAVGALGRGTLDAAWLLTGVLAVRDEAFNVLEGPPFGPGLERYVTWRREARVRAVADRLYAAQDLKGMLCGVAPGWDLWLKAPLQSGADLRGKRVRSNGLRGRVYAEAGAKVLAMSPGEVHNALAAGAIDAAEYLDVSGAVQARLHEVARRWHAAPLSRAVGIELVFRRSVWEQLDAGTRQRIEQQCARGLAQAIKTQSERVTAATATLRESGAAVAPLPPGVAAALRDAWRRVQAQLAANSAAAELLLTIAPYSSN